MCQNDIVAFGMNLAEILLSMFTVGFIIALGVVMIAYLNGHIFADPETKTTGGTLTREQISELHSHMKRKA